MADNVVLNSGTGGATLATDDVGGVHYQIVKLAYGALDAANVVSDSNPLPIDDAGGSITVDGSVSITGALPAGTNNIGDVDIASALPAGTNNIGDVDVASFPHTDTDDDVVAGAQTAVLGISLSYAWDGTQWERLASDASGSLKVNLTAALPAGTNNIGDVDVLTLPALPAGTNNIGDVDIASALPAGDNNIGNVDVVTLPALPAGTNNIGDVDVLSLPALPAGSNNIGDVDIASALPAGTNNIGDVDIASALPAGANLIGDVGLSGARTSGGTTLYKNIDVDETEDQIKATAGQVYWIHAINLANAPRYLKFYNATAANVTVGTTTPDLTFPIPSQGDTNGAGFTLSIPNGIAFGTAITIAATTGLADNDSGAPGANEVVVNLGYA